MLGEKIVFLIGFLVLFFFALWFFAKKEETPNYRVASIVASVTSLSYLLMLSGQAVILNSSGETVYFTRWFFYIASCSLLMVTMANVLKTKKDNVLPVLMLNGLVMLSGAIAAFLESPMKWVVFGLGCVFFIKQIVLLFEGESNKKIKDKVGFFIFFGWSLFPVIFILAPEGIGIVNNLTAAILYLGLDVLTKIIFYFQLDKIKK